MTGTLLSLLTFLVVFVVVVIVGRSWAMAGRVSPPCPLRFGPFVALVFLWMLVLLAVFYVITDAL